MKINHRRLSQSLHLHFQSNVWLWCSHRLHPRWQHQFKGRNDCLLVLAYAVHQDATIPPERVLLDHPEIYAEQPEPLFTRETLREMWKSCPAYLLHLCLGLFNKEHSLAAELEAVRVEFGKNPELDGLVKRMRYREVDHPNWMVEGQHPAAEIRDFSRGMAPLLDRIEEVLVDNFWTIEQIAREFLRGGPFRVGTLPAHSFCRRTPVGFLNRIQRLHLWKVAQAIQQKELDSTAELEALSNELTQAISPAVQESLEREGYTVDDIVDDMINFDRFLTQTELLA